MKDQLRPYYIKYKAQKEKLKDQFFGNRNYQKFVVISDSRTGSTLLMQLLNSHPEIICLGEEFKKLKGSTSLERWKDIFRNRTKKTRWLGFKLFYFHPSDSADNKVWEFIEKDKEIVIIHLTRRNILRSFLSKQIGLKTRKWTENINRPHEIDETDKKIKLDPQACEANFTKTKDYIEKTEDRFKNHNIIRVVYEDLDKDKQKEMTRIYNALKVPDFEVSTVMKRQNPEELDELILNYQELKTYFKGSQWDGFFQVNNVY